MIVLHRKAIKIITGVLVAACVFFTPLSSAFAALQAIQSPQVSQDQRDKYQANLFTGSSQYSYPIKVPKGTDNLTPEVSLTYNNQGAHALPMYGGDGWEVSKDYIQRDVNFTPVTTSDDKYKLHFKGTTYDLIYNSSDSLFHTSVESHLKIQQFLSGGQGSTGIYWQVTTTDGTVYRFGYVANSEFVCNGQSYDGYWNLDQVTDVHNNHIYYSYTNSSGVAYLNQIQYNTDQLREIDFSYITNPYQITMYQQGCSVTEGSRLSTIRVKANGSLVHEYDFNFSQATNSQNLLTSITEKGNDGSTTLPATSFSYNPEVQNWQTSYGTWINNAPIDVNLTDSSARLIDVNGDGFLDIVKSYQNGGSDTWKVLLNTGSSWSTSWQMWIDNAPIDSHLADVNTTMADVNGDGLPDIIKSYQNGGSDTWKVLLNTGSNWSTSWQTWINNASIDTYVAQANTRIIDVNGDGLPDIIKTYQNGGSDTWKVLLNTGSSWQTSYSTWIDNAPIDSNFTDPNTTLVDVNGDELPDIIKTYQNGGNDTWKVLLNMGNAWQTTWTTWIDNAPTDSNLQMKNVRVADVNGDSLPDIVKTEQNGGNDTWKVWLNNGYAPDTLANVKTEKQGTVQFSYGASAQYQNTNLFFPLGLSKQ